MSASLVALDAFAGAMERAGIEFLVAGSIASSTHGLMRSTEDLDIAAEIPLSKVEAVVRELEARFDVDEEALREAVQRKRSCNLYFVDIFTRIDLYVLSDTPFNRSRMSRRQRLTVQGLSRSIPVATAEDIVLKKLEWFKQGGEVSQRQWNDVLGVLRVQGSRLDSAYLESWALQLGVDAQLHRALGEASRG